MIDMPTWATGYFGGIGDPHRYRPVVDVGHDDATK